MNETIQLAALVVVLNNGLTEAIIAPLRQKYPEWDLWWMIYVSWGLGIGLSLLFNLNLLVGKIPNETAGLILSAIIIGRGSNLLADVINILKMGVSNGVRLTSNQAVFQPPAVVE